MSGAGRLWTKQNSNYRLLTTDYKLKINPFSLYLNKF